MIYPETGRPVIAVNEVDAAAVIVKSLKRCNEVFRLPVEQLHHQLPALTVPVGEIEGHRIFPFLPKVNIDREGLTAGDIVLALISPRDRLPLPEASSEIARSSFESVTRETG